MVMKKASGDNLPSGRVPGRASHFSATVAAARNFSAIFARLFRVFPSGWMERKGGAGRWARWATPAPGAASAGAAPGRGVGPLCPCSLPFGLLESSGVKLRKICFLVPSNSENISCVTF